MAVSTTTPDATWPVAPKNDDLTDDQINLLLASAAARRREKMGLSVVDEASPVRDWNFPKLDVSNLDEPYISSKDGVNIVDDTRLVGRQHRQQEHGFRKVEDPVEAQKTILENKKATAGPEWFNLPKTDLTPELKRDIQLIRMRNVLDPHRHYKKDGGKIQAPEYSQVGTVIEGPTEFFTGRIENKKRKKTFVEEVLSGEQETGRFKKKYGDLQSRKTSGKKAYYTAMKEKRRGGVKKGGRG